jgi:hypothetical protein
MDSILSRKLFRDKYVEEIKPQKNNQGGITTLKLAEGGEVISENEKLGYLLAPVAASLLQAKQRPGESSLSSLFGAVGEGVAQMPAIGLKIAEIQGKKKTTSKEIKELNAAEKQKYGFMQSDVALGTYTDGVLSEIPKATFDTKEVFKEIRTGLDKSGALGADEALRSLEVTLQDLSRKGQGGDLPGLGFIDGRIWTTTEGRNLRSQLASFSNIRLKDRSGGAVTDSELNRYLEEIAGGQTTMDENALLGTVQKARAEMEKEKIKLINQYDQRGSKAFIEQGGINFYESPGYIKSKTAAAGIFPVKDDSEVIDGIKTKFVAGVPVYLNPKDGVWKRTKPIQIKQD